MLPLKRKEQCWLKDAIYWLKDAIYWFKDDHCW